MKGRFFFSPRRLKHTQQYFQLCLGFLWLFFFSIDEGVGGGGGVVARWLSTVEAAAAPGVARLGFDHLSSEIPPMD